jgi:hypothetical protein
VIEYRLGQDWGKGGEKREGGSSGFRKIMEKCI